MRWRLRVEEDAAATALSAARAVANAAAAERRGRVRLEVGPPSSRGEQAAAIPQEAGALVHEWGFIQRLQQDGVEGTEVSKVIGAHNQQKRNREAVVFRREPKVVAEARDMRRTEESQLGQKVSPASKTDGDGGLGRNQLNNTVGARGPLQPAGAGSKAGAGERAVEEATQSPAVLSAALSSAASGMASTEQAGNATTDKTRLQLVEEGDTVVDSSTEVKKIRCSSPGGSGSSGPPGSPGSPLLLSNQRTVAQMSYPAHTNAGNRGVTTLDNSRREDEAEHGRLVRGHRVSKEPSSGSVSPDRPLGLHGTPAASANSASRRGTQGSDIPENNLEDLARSSGFTVTPGPERHVEEDACNGGSHEERSSGTDIGGQDAALLPPATTPRKSEPRRVDGAFVAQETEARPGPELSEGYEPCETSGDAAIDQVPSLLCSRPCIGSGFLG